MNTHKLIETFYTSFSNGNSKGMADCYHKDIVFQDPVFGTLKGKRACKMWEMLLAKRTESTQISFDNIKTNADQGTATWKAEYTYGETNRKVINIVHANFKFKDGKIIEHIDSFNLWKWTQQAMGFAGYLLGWTPFLKSIIQKTTHKKLNDFINNK